MKCANQFFIIVLLSYQFSAWTKSEWVQLCVFASFPRCACMEFRCAHSIPINYSIVVKYYRKSKATPKWIIVWKLTQNMTHVLFFIPMNGKQWKSVSKNILIWIKSLGKKRIWKFCPRSVDHIRQHLCSVIQRNPI